ncbi:MAG: ATP-binding cassette domain-containing protein [Anaeroplasmataceae bacterium]|nr:ATP-binding cassette domain-containing protein [Anaeroplasmataceae bacterium]MDE6413950.1 ATP-binding cassette domain-containing protein [Anaeroplasmataceae bacterium]
MIEINHLVKEFKRPVRKQGLLGMFKTLFSRKYETKIAVNDISLKINEGEIVGYIGSNGAGKSTTIKMMCGILTPTSGNVYIDGLEPYKKRKKVVQNIGVVFGQKTQLWWDIPLIESFKVLKEIYQVSEEDYQERMSFLCEILGINDFINQPVRTLSLGQRMRADLAASWIHNPKILFLDEPTIGLDVFVKEKIRQAIKSMNQKYHTTVLLTTHDMQDIENLCSRIIILEQGNIIYDDSLEKIKNQFGNIKTISIKLKDKINIDDLNDFDNEVTYEQKGEDLILKFNADHVSLESVMQYVFKEFSLTDLNIKGIGIEEVVKNLLASEEMEKNNV